ncbi:MAG: sugar ABC transporter permease [Oscillospiraceae bacterium]|nr:sugar ABC transporter permease [Oscillospiraceae bacterium]
MKRNRMLTLPRKRALTGFLFVLPFTAGFLLFYVNSIVTTVRMSLSEVTVGVAEGVRGMSMQWNDFFNYIRAFSQHATFKQDLTSSLLNMLIDLPLIIFFSLFMALFLNQKFRGRTVARAIFFLPVILGAPAISEAINMARALMVGGISPASAEVMASLGAGTTIDVGYYLYMLGNLAVPPVLINYIIGAVARINNVITASGVQIVIFVAALQSIAPALYEVAKIEGATSYETFWKITFPMVSPLIVTNVVYTIVDSFAKSQIVTLSYDTIFTDYNYGLGAVFSLVSSVAVCLILLMVGWLLSRRTFYHI